MSDIPVLMLFLSAVVGAVQRNAADCSGAFVPVPSRRAYRRRNIAAPACNHFTRQQLVEWRTRAAVVV
jgi:hypothetical protein